MNVMKFFRRGGLDHKSKLGIDEVAFITHKPSPGIAADDAATGITAIQEAMGAQVRAALNDIHDADVAVIENAPGPEPAKQLTVTEHYDRASDEALTWLMDRRDTLVANRKATTENYERYIAETDEDLRQVEIEIAAQKASKRIRNGEASDEEIARANERAREIVRSGARSRRKPAAKAPNLAHEATS